MAPKAGKGAARKAAAKGKAKKQQAKQDVAKRSKTETRIDLFVQEYLIDLNGRQAAIRAGYSPDSARQIASELLAKPEVAQKVQDAIAQRAQVTSITAEAVVNRLNLIATADARELSELHRGSCRYCWGKDNRYQRTPAELERDRAQYEVDLAEATKAGKKLPPFDDTGGIGFNPKRDPNPNCPECFGDGELRVVLKDTRDLSPAARLLFAGVKQTQHGIEIKTHSQVDSLVNVGRHVGAFKDRLEHTGKDGQPIQHSLQDIMEAIEGADTGIGPATSRKE